MRKLFLVVICVVTSGCFLLDNGSSDTKNVDVSYENTVEGHKEVTEVQKQELNSKMSVREVELQKLNELESKFNKFSTLLEEKETKLAEKIKSMRHDEYSNTPSYHIPFCGDTGFEIISNELRELLEVFDMKEYMRVINDIKFLVESSNTISYSDTFVTEEKIEEIVSNGVFYSEIAKNLRKNVIFSFYGQNWNFVNVEETPLSFKKDNAFLWIIKNGTVIQIADGSYRIFNDGVFTGYDTQQPIVAPSNTSVPIKSGYSVPKKHRGVSR